MRTRLACPIALLALLVLAACSTANVPMRYYALAPASPAAAATAKEAPELRVAILKLSLPEAVDRAAVVLRTSPTRLEVLDNDRWAEGGLRREIPRVLAARLNAQQSRAQVSFYPQAASDLADYALDLDVERYDAERGKGVALTLQWNLRPARDSESAPLRGGRLELRAAARDDSVDALVEATGAALDQAAAAIAPALGGLPPAAVPVKAGLR